MALTSAQMPGISEILNALDPSVTALAARPPKSTGFLGLSPPPPAASPRWPLGLARNAAEYSFWRPTVSCMAWAKRLSGLDILLFDELARKGLWCRLAHARSRATIEGGVN